MSLQTENQGLLAKKISSVVAQRYAKELTYYQLAWKSKGMLLCAVIAAASLILIARAAMQLVVCFLFDFWLFFLCFSRHILYFVFSDRQEKLNVISDSIDCISWELKATIFLLVLLAWGWSS